MTMNVLVSDAGSVSLMLSGEICPGGALGPELLTTISISNDSVSRTIFLICGASAHFKMSSRKYISLNTLFEFGF